MARVTGKWREQQIPMSCRRGSATVGQTSVRLPIVLSVSRHRKNCFFTSGALRAYLQSNGTMLTAHVGSLTPCELLSHQADAIKHLPPAIPPGFTKCLRTHLPLWRYRFIACDRRSKNWAIWRTIMTPGASNWKPNLNLTQRSKLKLVSGHFIRAFVVGPGWFSHIHVVTYLGKKINAPTKIEHPVLR